MKFLIVNDDGYQAEGIKTLVEYTKKYGEVVVYSPFKCESAQSHKITIHGGLKVEKLDCYDVEAYTVHGSAADCVRLGLFLHPDVNIVLSGINHGLNVGHDVYYSSTISAVVEAGLKGYRGIAFSCDKNYDDVRENQLEKVLDELILNNANYEPLINVNFPSQKFSEFKGFKQTLGGYWQYKNIFELKDGIYHEGIEMINDTTEGNDSFETIQGYVSVTNISLVRTYK